MKKAWSMVNASGLKQGLAGLSLEDGTPVQSVTHISGFRVNVLFLFTLCYSKSNTIYPNGEIKSWNITVKPGLLPVSYTKTHALNTVPPQKQTSFSIVESLN